MFIWLGIFTALFSLSVWLIIHSSQNENEWREMIGWLLATIFLFCIAINTAIGVSNYNQAMDYSFRIAEIQKEVDISELDSANLVIEKHNINKWVRNAKISRIAYGEFSNYPAMVLDLPVIPVEK